MAQRQAIRTGQPERLEPLKEWVFTPDEFSQIWQAETGLDQHPYPINLAPQGASSTTATETERANEPEQHFPDTEPDLAGALGFFTRSEATTIVAFGDLFEGEERLPDPILALGAGYAGHGAAVTATADQVKVRACPASDVSEHVVAALGEVPAGSLPVMREPRGDVLYPDPAQCDTESTRRAQRLRRVLHRPIDARGFLTVTVCPTDPDSPPPAHRTWLDFSDDGRYLLSASTDLTLVPVTSKALAGQLSRLAQLH